MTWTGPSHGSSRALALMFLLKCESGGGYLAGNKHERRSFEVPSALEIADYQAELVLVLFGKRGDYRLLLTADDVRRITQYASLRALG